MTASYPRTSLFPWSLHELLDLPLNDKKYSYNKLKSIHKIFHIMSYPDAPNFIASNKL